MRGLALAALLTAVPGLARASAVITAIPEPTALGLIAAGVAGLAVARWRRK
jgi:hypothetical protein